MAVPALVTTGAVDRFNYGDLLFPVVLDAAATMNDLPPLVHAATTAADMTDVGGAAAVSSRTALGGDVRGIVVGGGEVVGATWGQALTSLIPAPFDLGLRLADKMVGHRALDRFAKRVLGGSWPTPYIPDVITASNIPCAANAIGASSIDVLDSRTAAEVVESLRRFRLVNVRDAVGQRVLESHGVYSELVPDSVAILPSIRTFNTIPEVEGALVFQCSRGWARHFGAGLVDQLTELSRSFESIHLLSIGLAGGHGDAMAAANLERALRSRGVQASVNTEHTIDRIAATIKSARCFVGTSLHGAITSLAFATPSVALAGVGKLDAYLESWSGGLVPYSVRVDALAGATDAALKVDVERRQDHAQSLAALAQVGLDRVLGAVNV